MKIVLNKDKQEERIDSQVAKWCDIVKRNAELGFAITELSAHVDMFRITRERFNDLLESGGTDFTWLVLEGNTMSHRNGDTRTAKIRINS